MGHEQSKTYTESLPQVYAKGKFIRLGAYIIPATAIAFLHLKTDGTIEIRMLDNSSNDNSSNPSVSVHGIDAFVTAPMTSLQIDCFFAAMGSGK